MTPSDAHTDPAPSASPQVLRIDDASVARDGSLALDRLSLGVDAGQHTAILGANGSGKSTLVQLIARQLYPLAHGHAQRPAVRVFGQARWHVAELRKRLGIVSPALQEDYTGGDAPPEVLETVLSGFYAARGLWVDHHPSAAMHAQARAALADVGASALIGRSMATLSTGEARRVLIARALVHAPQALLLDEPCAGLDMAARRRFLERLRALARGGTTLLMVSHHAEEIVPETRQVVLLKSGRVLAAGAPAEVLTERLLGEAYGMPITVRASNGWYSASPR